MFAKSTALINLLKGRGRLASSHYYPSQGCFSFSSTEKKYALFNKKSPKYDRSIEDYASKYDNREQRKANSFGFSEDKSKPFAEKLQDLAILKSDTLKQIQVLVTTEFNKNESDPAIERFAYNAKKIEECTKMFKFLNSYVRKQEARLYQKEKHKQMPVKEEHKKTILNIADKLYSQINDDILAIQESRQSLDAEQSS